jgi:hypothetical protein
MALGKMTAVVLFGAPFLRPPAPTIQRSVAPWPSPLPTVRLLRILVDISAGGLAST